MSKKHINGANIKLIFLITNFISFFLLFFFGASHFQLSTFHCPVIPSRAAYRVISSGAKRSREICCVLYLLLYTALRSGAVSSTPRARPSRASVGMTVGRGLVTFILTPQPPLPVERGWLTPLQ
jgi:TctA family transporter